MVGSDAYDFVVFCGLALVFVFMIYSNRSIQLRAYLGRKDTEVSNRNGGPAGTTGFTGGANNGGSWRDSTCGQIRPGEWQCNCKEPENGCVVLRDLKANNKSAEEVTNRRGAIAAQKARKRNGR